MKKIQIEKEMQEKIIMLSKQGIKYRNIHKIINPNFSEMVIYNFLKENNLINSGAKHRKYNFTQNYFEVINTEDKAYWLGFLYADGNVHRNTISIRLAIKDIEHVKKFKNTLCVEYDIECGVQNSFGTMVEYCRISVHSKKMKTDLIALGCFIKKSKILKYPTEEQVPKYLIYHFIRGYFDGDGSIIVPTGKFAQVSLSFVGTYDMLLGIKKQLEVNTSIKIDKRVDIYTLLFGGNLNSLEKLELLYKDASVYLERKYNRYENLKNKYNKELIEERSKYSSRLC